MSKIKAIVFDWHGVLDKTKYEDIVNILSECSGIDSDGTRKILSEVCLERDYVKGIISPNTFWESVELYFGRLGYVRAKESILSFSSNYSLWEALKGLRYKFDLSILSDCPQDKLDVIQSMLSLETFKTKIFSCVHSQTKNDDEFFNKISKSLFCEPKQIMYVDDSLRHVETAKRLGFNAFHYIDTTTGTTDNLVNVLHT